MSAFRWLAAQWQSIRPPVLGWMMTLGAALLVVVGFLIGCFTISLTWHLARATLRGEVAAVKAQADSVEWLLTHGRCVYYAPPASDTLPPTTRLR